MKHRRLARALTLLAVPALLVSALSSPADAVRPAPETPSPNAVRNVLPNLQNASTFSVAGQVRSTRKDCTPGKVVRGSTARTTMYMPRGRRSTPFAVVEAARFRTAADARAQLRRVGRPKCAGDGLFGPVGKTTRVRFHVGDHRVGFRSVQRHGGETAAMYFLSATRGRVLVTTMVFAGGRHVPSERQAIRFARLALRTAR